MSKDALSLPDDPAQLRALLLEERARRQATEAQHAQALATLAQIETTLSSQQQKIQQQEHTIAQLLRRLYSPRQERIDPNQLTLFDAEELQALAAELAFDQEEPSPSPLAGKAGHGRRALPRNLPREQVR